MRKKTTLTRVFMALILTLTMMVFSTTVFAAEATTENGDQQVITADNENASAAETRANGTTTKRFKALEGAEINPVTTYVNPVMYISVTDTYKSSNIYMVSIKTPNGNTYKYQVTGNGRETRIKFSPSGQYTVKFSFYTGTSNNGYVTGKVRFANEL